jgi:hypothetical protein
LVNAIHHAVNAQLNPPTLHHSEIEWNEDDDWFAIDTEQGLTKIWATHFMGKTKTSQEASPASMLPTDMITCNLLVK